MIEVWFKFCYSNKIELYHTDIIAERMCHYLEVTTLIPTTSSDQLFRWILCYYSKGHFKCLPQ